MKILVTGLQNAVEESVVKLALERVEGKAEFKTLSFSDFTDEEETPAEELRLIKATQQKVTDGIRMKLIGTSRGNIIINGYCTVKTKLGFFPVITREIMEALKPDLMAHIDVDPRALEGKIVNRKEFEDHQDFERSYSLLLCTSTGYGMKIIHCGFDESRKAADELYALLKNLMVKK
jgi:adenylate kinase